MSTVRQRLATSAFLHNEDLLEIVFRYLHPTERLAVVLTSSFFFSICHKHDLTRRLKTSPKWFCGSKATIAWAIACGSPKDSIGRHATMASRDEENALELLQWLNENKICPFQVWTFEAAAEKGYVEVLKWLRSQDPPCPWSERTCELAAQYGQTEVLKWVQLQDPHWMDEYVWDAAYRGGHSNVLQWLYAQDDYSLNGFAAAAREGDLNRVERIRLFAQNIMTILTNGLNWHL